MNKEMGAVRRKRSKKWKPNNYPSLQCSTTPVGFGQGLISKEQCDNTGASPNLAPADFYPFPRLKSTVKGRRFCGATDIIRSWEELKKLSKNGFQECRLQMCIIAQGNYL